MSLPALVVYKTEAEYKNHFIKKYCRRKIVTFDGVEVNFYESNFDHAFYEGIDKDVFAQVRAERIDWIEYILKEPTAELYKGWNKGKSKYTSKKKVYLLHDKYIVVIQFKGVNKAIFITAFNPDVRTLSFVKNSEKWS